MRPAFASVRPYNKYLLCFNEQELSQEQATSKRFEARISSMSSHLEQDSQSYSAQVETLRDRIAALTTKYDSMSMVLYLLFD